MPPLRGALLSQDPNRASGGVSRQQVDIGLLPVGPVNCPFSPPAVPPNIPPVTETTHGGAPPVAEATANKSKPRARFSKRKILASSSLFLATAYKGFFPDSLVEIVGKIEECPRAVNQNRYRIDWNAEFEHLTCFEIAHSEKGKGMWTTNPDGKYKSSVCHTHPIIKRLRVQHGLPETTSRKRRRINNDGDDEEATSTHDDGTNTTQEN